MRYYMFRDMKLTNIGSCGFYIRRLDPVTGVYKEEFYDPIAWIATNILRVKPRAHFQTLGIFDSGDSQKAEEAPPNVLEHLGFLWDEPTNNTDSTNTEKPQS